MKLLDLSNVEKQYPNLIIYQGMLDKESENPTIEITMGESRPLPIRLKEIYNKRWISALSVEELKTISKLFNIKANIYPSGNISFSKLDSSEDELKQCFLMRENFNNDTYYICVALEEIQASVYKSQLVGLVIGD